MTYGPPSDPTSAPQPPQDPTPPQTSMPPQTGMPGQAPQPGQLPPAPMPAQPVMPPPSPYADPRQQWAGPSPYGAPAVGSRRGAGPGAASLIVGLLGIVLPFLPLELHLSDWRPYVALPLGLVGVVLAIVGCIGFRAGKPAAVVGLILSALALAIGLVMLGGFYHYSG